MTTTTGPDLINEVSQLLRDMHCTVMLGAKESELPEAVRDDVRALLAKIDRHHREHSEDWHRIAAKMQPAGPETS